MDYQQAYEILFNAITGALAELDTARNQTAEMIRIKTILQSVQRQTESMYIEDD